MSATATNEEAVGLPSLSMNRKLTWDYYRLEFLADGYPGRRVDDVVHAHPIYGAYVINDYLGQYRKTRDDVFLNAATRVADAAVSRMVEFENSLIFRYEPGIGLSSLPNSFYSGLTQSRYLSCLGRLEVALGARPYTDATAGILRSLRVPAEAGGVARPTPHGGLLIEEYSHSVPDYTLNGWTTATLLVHEFAEATGDPDARELFDDSTRGISEVLPLYDVGELFNSRYRLTGPARIRFQFSESGVRFSAGEVDIPGQGSYPMVPDNGGRWTNSFMNGVEPDGRLTSDQAVAEVLISRISWPVPNILRVEVEAPRAGQVTIQIGEGPYSPITVQSVVDQYTDLDQVELVRGQNTIAVTIPWAKTELVAYPTSFTKVIGGRRFNSYHFIHIDTLTSLARITADPMFAYYRDRWAAFPARWPDLPEYSEADIELERYTVATKTVPTKTVPTEEEEAVAPVLSRILPAG